MAQVKQVCVCDDQNEAAEKATTKDRQSVDNDSEGNDQKDGTGVKCQKKCHRMSQYSHRKSTLRMIPIKRVHVKMQKTKWEAENADLSECMRVSERASGG